MKVYCFYLISNEINREKFIVADYMVQTVGDKQLFLYAVTNKKTYAEEFISTRNNSLFIQKIIDISKNKYEDFINSSLSVELNMYTYTTKIVKNNKYTSSNCDILSTYSEYEAISRSHDMYCEDLLADTITEEFVRFMHANPLKSKINKAVNKTLEMDEILYTLSPYDDTNFDITLIDEVYLYSKLFSNTYKKKVIE